MEKVSVDTEKQRSSRWINALTLLTVVQTLAFVGVTIVTFLDVLELDQKDIDLRYGIQDLESKLKDSFSGPATTKEPEEQPEEVLERIRRHVTSRLATRQSSLFVDMLKIQEKILEKHCQARNKTCPSGLRGDKGSRGQQGFDGLGGQPGFNGQAGAQGLQGQPGVKGLNGSAGLKGEPGVTGAVGPVGQNGTRGEDGLKGLKGEPGPNGLKGLPGPAGDVGDPGLAGAQGINKTKGHRGDTGSPGIKGARGDPGTQGPKGNDSRKFADDCDCFIKPSFIPPSDTTVYIPLHATQDLPCNATGNPQPAVTVQKVPAGKRNVMSNGTNVMIYGTISSDYSRYVCEARNQFGTVMKYVTIMKPSGK